MSVASSHFDLAVIGGGPAGSSAAITAARRGVRTILFESKTFPRHKVCGEFVSAESLELLSSLMRNSAIGHVLLESAPRLITARLFLGSRMVEASLDPASVSIARYDLDAALWESAKAAGVEAIAGCEVTSLSGQGPFSLNTTRGAYQAGSVVVSAGRWSPFTPDRSLPTGPRWIGVKGHFRETNPSLTTDLYFFEHGYCGVQPVGENTVNACAMVRSDQARSLAEVFQLHSRLAERTSSWRAVTQPVTTAPLIHRAPRPSSGNLLLAGDAAAFVDPFVGDGISIALRSGQAAADALQAFFVGKIDLATSVSNYERTYRQQFAPLIAAAAKVRGLLSMPVAARAVAFELLRFPGVMPVVIRKTRRAS